MRRRRWPRWVLRGKPLFHPASRTGLSKLDFFGRVSQNNVLGAILRNGRDTTDRLGAMKLEPRPECPASGDAARDERGVVYVEFIIAFMPLFTMFLAVCQLALVGAAEAMVRHAAYAAVRSAIVILDDSEKHFGNAPRGELSAGDPAKMTNGIDSVARKLGVPVTGASPNAPARAGFGIGSFILRMADAAPRSAARALTAPQQGARMVPIKAAAQLPLIPLAPSKQLQNAQRESVFRALASPEERQLQYAVEYAGAASAVTIHAAPGTDAPIQEPVGWNTPVTAKVQYAYQCNVPMVRALMCRPLDQLLQTHYGKLVNADALKALVNPEARFKLLTGSATLPNQGANYKITEESD